MTEIIIHDVRKIHIDHTETLFKKGKTSHDFYVLNIVITDINGNINTLKLFSDIKDCLKVNFGETLYETIEKTL